MKTKYGSVAQYNYEIQEQNESEHDENAPQRHEDGRKSNAPITVLKNIGFVNKFQKTRRVGLDDENRASPYAAAMKKPVTSSTNIRKKSKFNQAYNDGNEGNGDGGHSQILQQSVKDQYVDQN